MNDLALVTGGTGFLGRELLAQLSADGRHWICASRKKTANEGAPALGLASPGAERSLVCLDLEREPGAIEALLGARRPAVIFHLAATAASGAAVFSGNLLPLLHLLDAIERVPDYSPRVVVAGSAAEYGDLGSEPLREDAREAPVTDYGVAKLAQTRLALARRRRKRDIVVARIFNALGPGMPATLAPGRFVQSARAATAQGATTLATGDLGTVRDYLDVREIAGALLLLSRADTGGSNGIVNVCSGIPTRMRDVLHEILRQLGMNLVPTQDGRWSKGSSEIPVSIGSTELFQRLTGKVLPFDLTRAVSRLLAPG